MDWIEKLFFGTGIAHSLLVVALVIALGVLCSRIRVKGISFGVTWILFMGIVAGHFGMTAGKDVLEFIREFGLVLFVYSIGLQVGPSFFSSFKKAGLKMNAVAMSAIFCGVAVTLAISFVEGIPIPTMVGIMSGAVTNTPGLGAAQQTFVDITGRDDPSIALGYAVAYPMGVVGLILSMMIIKGVFKVSFERERLDINRREGAKAGASRISIRLDNPSIFGRKIEDVIKVSGRHFVISRVSKKSNAGKILVAGADTVLDPGDIILVVADNKGYEGQQGGHRPCGARRFGIAGGGPRDSCWHLYCDRYGGKTFGKFNDEAAPAKPVAYISRHISGCFVGKRSVCLAWRSAIGKIGPCGWAAGGVDSA